MLSNHLRSLKDSRQTSKCAHVLHDVVMSGFACMYYQEPSLLSHQTHLKETRHQQNVKALFDIESLPSDSQMRQVLDAFNFLNFAPVFKSCFSRLQRGKHLEEYRLFSNEYLCSLDGTQFFSSARIQCSDCLTHHPGGSNEPYYQHKALQAALMHPDKKQVFPLMPEEISNRDGSNKQDCETNAAKRLIRQLRQDHRQLKFILLGDSLYSTQPMIEAAMEQRMSDLDPKKCRAS